jgi:hypothetical protein
MQHCKFQGLQAAVDFSQLADLNRTTSPLEYLYIRMLSLSTRTMSFDAEPEGFNVGCMDLPRTEAGPATRSFTVTKTGVSQQVLTTTLFAKRQPWLMKRLSTAASALDTRSSDGMHWLTGRSQLS